MMPCGCSTASAPVGYHLRRCALVLAVLAVHVATSVRADPTNLQSTSTNFSAIRDVIASGSGTSSGGDFSISGTIGQADVDPLQPSTGGDFAITGGFWPTLAPRTDLMFSNGFESP